MRETEHTSILTNAVLNNTVRHSAPFFAQPKTKQLRVKTRLVSALKKKNFNRDSALQELRENGGQVDLYFKKCGILKKKYLPVRRSNIRIERMESLRELGFAFIEHCDYSVDSAHLFEIAYAPETLAKMIGQHHFYPPTLKYPNGRSAYDCVLNALYDYEASGQIVVVRQFDEKAGINKASRLFLAPKFFEMLGVNRAEMLNLLRELKRVKGLQGKVSASNAYHEKQFTRRRSNDRVADVQRSDIKKILRNIRADIMTGLVTPAPQVAEKVKPGRLADYDTKGVPEAQLTNAQTLGRFKSSMAPAAYHLEKMKVDMLELSFDDAQKRLIESLRPLLQ